MKRFIFIILTPWLLFSCKTVNVEPVDITGKFYAKVSKNDFINEYMLELNKNNSFSFMYRVHGASPKCEGQWSLLENKLLLNCDEIKNTYEMLSSGYMNQRDFLLEIIDNSTLKFGNTVLKRVD